MAKRLTLQPATAAELASLSDWYDQTGITQAKLATIRDDMVPKFIEAHNEGILGTAVGGTLGTNLAALTTLPLDRWRYARTYIAALRLDGQTIGMLHLGPPPIQYWDHLMTPSVRSWTKQSQPTEPEEWPADVRRFLTGTLAIDKLALVAVTPQQRHKGHGTRLIKHAIHTARTGNSAILYGQFAEPNARLRTIYSRAGFEVLQPGEPLDVYMATGAVGDRFGGQPTESFFLTFSRD